MSIWSDLRTAFAPMPEPEPGHRLVDIGDRTTLARIAKEGRVQVRDGPYPPLTQQIQGVWDLRGSASPWAVPTVRQAMGVPSIFRANSLIYNTVGSLAVETYRNGQLLVGDQSPRLVHRPDPFRNAFEFYRDTAAYGANRGEAWWWVAKRDANDLADALVVVPPWEVLIDRSEDRLRPRIFWTVDATQIEMDPRDMRHIVFFPDPDGGPRGLGPLQLCGAAVSVAVESTEWAANYYAGGGTPPVWIKAAGTLGNPVDDPDGVAEAQALKNTYMNRGNNTPFVTDEGIEDVKDFAANEQGAQMLDARLQNRGDVANMYGIPGKLLEYSAPGSSLTYENVQEVFREWVRSSLQISFLEPIEHALTDLLSRTTVAKFNLDSFERADPKARWETYKIMGEVLGTEEAASFARMSEGLAPGDIEFAPVPSAPPAALPASLPVSRSSDPVRCSGSRMLAGKRKACGKLLSESGVFTGPCPRCGTFTDTSAVA